MPTPSMPHRATPRAETYRSLSSPAPDGVPAATRSPRTPIAPRPVPELSAPTSVRRLLGDGAPAQPAVIGRLIRRGRHCATDATLLDAEPGRVHPGPGAHAAHPPTAQQPSAARGPCWGRPDLFRTRSGPCVTARCRESRSRRPVPTPPDHEHSHRRQCICVRATRRWSGRGISLLRRTSARLDNCQPSCAPERPSCTRALCGGSAPADATVLPAMLEDDARAASQRRHAAPSRGRRGRTFRTPSTQCAQREGRPWRSVPLGTPSAMSTISSAPTKSELTPVESVLRRFDQ